MNGEDSMNITKETLFISDTHFYHKNIIKYEPSRVESFEQSHFGNQEQMLVSNWNGTCSPEQLIVHMGDFYFGKKKHLPEMKYLNGDKFLLKGNHDNFADEVYEGLGFRLIKETILEEELKENEKLLELLSTFQTLKYSNLLIFSFEGLRFLVSHFQMINTTQYDQQFEEQIQLLKAIFDEAKCDYNLHGHTHSNLMEDDRCINLSVEHTAFKPISLGEIIQKIKR
jgi:calcineurin-like phosphoesterase family protein